VVRIIWEKQKDAREVEAALRARIEKLLERDTE
jgi:hypothetical protein